VPRIVHYTATVQEGMSLELRESAYPVTCPAVVNCQAVTVITSQSSEVRHTPVAVKEGVLTLVRRLREAGNLPRIVHR